MIKEELDDSHQHRQAPAVQSRKAASPSPVFSAKKTRPQVRQAPFSPERGPGPADRGWGSSVRGWRQRRADDLYLYGGGLTPELAELVKRTFRGVHLLTYLKREELVELGRENKLDGAAEAARIAQDETLGTDTSEIGI